MSMNYGSLTSISLSTTDNSCDSNNNSDSNNNNSDSNNSDSNNSNTNTNTNNDSDTDTNKFHLENKKLNGDFIDEIFNFNKKYNQLADILKNELNLFLNNESNIKSGGFFDYSKNKRIKYHKEYIKCRNLYLKLKNK